MTWWDGGAEKREEIRRRLEKVLRSRLEHAASDRTAWSRAFVDAAQILGFVGAALWLRGADLRLHCVLFGSTVEMELFEQETRSRAFAPGEGLPGRTWLHRTAEWIPNVIHDDNFPRLRGAIRDLVRTVVAFPVFRGGEVVAVIEMYSRAIRSADEETIALFKRLGEIVGELSRFEDDATA